MKILILGYSKIVQRRVIKNLCIKKNLKIFVASKSFKNPIPGVKKIYNSYEYAIKDSKPNLIFISLPNSKHFFWAKKSLKSKCHTIVDKPITSKYKDIERLIKISKDNKRLLVEATYYNYHSQIKKIKKIFDQDKKKKIDASFIIPMPNKRSILLSKKLGGGVLMDMGPYISSIPRIFNLKNIINKKISVKKNKSKLIVSIQIHIIFKEGEFKGKFAFGGKYKNKLKIKNNLKTAEIQRVFSPPDNQQLFLKYINKRKIKRIKIKNENVFKNFFSEVRSKLKKKKFDYYYKRMLLDGYFRSNLLK